MTKLLLKEKIWLGKVYYKMYQRTITSHIYVVAEIYPYKKYLKEANDVSYVLKEKDFSVAYSGSFNFLCMWRKSICFRICPDSCSEKTKALSVAKTEVEAFANKVKDYMDQNEVKLKKWLES